MTFEEIYRAHSGRILNLIHRMTRREDVARDLTQDVFLKVYDNLKTFRHEAELSTWIHRIAVNHVLNHLKREKRLRPQVAANENPGRIVQLGDGNRERTDGSVETGSESALERAELVEIVRCAIQGLPPKYRVPLVLFHYEGLSYREIGDLLDLSLSAVESRIHRAKRQLVALLKPMAGDL